jgi:hypothetical protein
MAMAMIFLGCGSCLLASLGLALACEYRTGREEVGASGAQQEQSVPRCVCVCVVLLSLCSTATVPGCVHIKKV